MELPLAIGASQTNVMNLATIKNYNILTAPLFPTNAVPPPARTPPPPVPEAWHRNTENVNFH